MSIIEKGKNLLSKLSTTTIAEISTDNKVPEEEVISQILNLLGQILVPDKEITHTNAFNMWVISTNEKIPSVIEEYIHSAYYRNSRLDASRSLEKITTTLIKPNNQFAWLMDVCVHDLTRLGDGSAYFDESVRSWNMTQKKGLYPHKSHLIIRQRK